jgi:4-hydroxythreonine-4-phosphate dehydrogenase
MGITAAVRRMHPNALRAVSRTNVLYFVGVRYADNLSGQTQSHALMEVSVKPVLIGLTMGDPAGIGPEIALKALSSSAIAPGCRICIVGDLAVLERARSCTGVHTPLRTIEAAGQWQPDVINVIDLHAIRLEECAPGARSGQCGKASYAYITKAIAMARAGEIDAIVTNPIHKESLAMGGIRFAGHTEMLAYHTNTRDFSMMFLLDKVAVVHVTTHCSVREAIERITRERVMTHIRLLHQSLIAMGLSSPRIAVGGLNPHAGEHGLFGREEIEHIEPAVALVRKEGIQASGPFPPDTVFMRSFRGEFDGVVSMLHDHGFVALKSRDFERGVNVTIGLPIIRTSVGHGTAFDLAGTGKASEKSLLEAIRVARQLAISRRAR